MTDPGQSERLSEQAERVQENSCTVSIAFLNEQSEFRKTLTENAQHFPTVSIAFLNEQSELRKTLTENAQHFPAANSSFSQ